MGVELLDDRYLAITALVVAAYQLIFSLTAFVARVEKFKLFAGSVNFILLALLTFLLAQTYSTRQIIAFVLVVFWGLRAAGDQIFRVIHNAQMDDEAEVKCFSHLSFTLLQIFWVWAVSLPFTMLNSPSAGGNPTFGSVTDILGLILWIVGFTFRAVADFQRNQHYSQRFGQLEILKSGLWSYSRYPNYLGEILTWWGMFLLCLQPTISAGLATNWVSILSPITVVFSLFFVTGVLQREKSTQQKFYESPEFSAYKDYLDRTSLLIPMPSDLYIRLPLWSKAVFFFEWPIFRYAPAWKTTYVGHKIGSMEQL
ncbi:DUF1295-domain-containing protein [Basidiobolus meristosporus CBS 931.73]|uniref:DUF1295-domain-containing protein n=1 Tax=Basidiobolus meristosporus CBS 931.73 TaxID=1314790 RepID=A0A1Y1YIP5_9FUNG|nr:DUF1295-domain-containing protein [Basidiobolus meristosporus CBS 931.73]|eukprot:ORX97733.1 DUF1295-domain-containing protein [Basidiobolus meristosporus CBS 931.73]